VATELSTIVDWPETLLEEINGDLLEADYWLASGSPVLVFYANRRDALIGTNLQ